MLRNKENGGERGKKSGQIWRSHHKIISNSLFYCILDVIFRIDLTLYVQELYLHGHHTTQEGLLTVLCPSGQLLPSLLLTSDFVINNPRFDFIGYYKVPCIIALYA